MKRKNIMKILRNRPVKTGRYSSVHLQMDDYQKILKKNVIALMLIFMSSLPLFSSGTTVFDFLNISQGARPLALSGAYCGISDDINTMNTNPAGLSMISRKQVSLAHTEWLDDVCYENAIFVNRLTDSSGFGFEFNYLHMGEMTGRDVNGRRTSDFSSRDLSLGVAYGTEFLQGHSIGFKLKYISEQIAQFQANTIALDIGSLNKTPVENLTFGIKIENIGPSVKFIKVNEPLPTKIWTGLGYRLIDNLILAMDSGFSSSEPTDVRFGIEYNMSDLGSLRAGFKNNSFSKTGLTENGMFSFGFGIVKGNYNIDYAYVPFGLLGDTHRISITMKFALKPDKYFLRLYKDKTLLKELPLE